MMEAVVVAVVDDDGDGADALARKSTELRAAAIVDAAVGDGADAPEEESCEVRAAMIPPFVFERDEYVDSTFRDDDDQRQCDEVWDSDSMRPDRNLPLHPRSLTWMVVFEAAE